MQPVKPIELYSIYVCGSQRIKKIIFAQYIPILRNFWLDVHKITHLHWGSYYRAVLYALQGIFIAYFYTKGYRRRTCQSVSQSVDYTTCHAWKSQKCCCLLLLWLIIMIIEQVWSGLDLCYSRPSLGLPLAYGSHIYGALLNLLVPLTAFLI